MKKLWFLLFIPVLGLAAYLVWQNLPSKRFAKHIVKARLYQKENNLIGARLEYEKAYSIKGRYTPYASLEVLTLNNRISLGDKQPQKAIENTRNFVKENPDKKEGYIMLAQLGFQSSEIATAFEALDSVLQKDPWNFPARLLLANVRTQQGRLDLAEEQLRFLYTKYPDSAYALLPMAEVLLQQNRFEECRKFLNHILGKNPTNAQARAQLVDTYLKEGKADTALRILDAWQAADPRYPQAMQIRKARVYSMTNEFDLAKAALADFREVKNENFPALGQLAIVHARKGEYDSAIEIYDKVSDLSPSSRQKAQTMAFYLQLKNQNPAKALEIMKLKQIAEKSPSTLSPTIAAYLSLGQENKAKELIALQPDSVQKPLTDFMSNLPADKEFIGQWALLIYYNLNHEEYASYEAAKSLYNRSPRNPFAINLYTAQLSNSGAFAEAAKVLSSLDKLDLPHETALLQLYISSRQDAKVLALAEKLAHEHPDIKEVNNILGDYWMGKDRSKAMQYYEKEFRINPENAVTLNNLAWEYGVTEKNLEKAAPYLEKLKSRKNLDPRILDTVGWILAINGNPQEAERYLLSATNLAPDKPSFQYHLAVILHKLGQVNEARNRLESALSSKIQFDEREDAAKLLAQLG